MLFGSSDEKRFVLGYDLGDKVSQISYLASDADMPETLSVLAGAELYISEYRRSQDIPRSSHLMMSR